MVNVSKLWMVLIHRTPYATLSGYYVSFRYATVVNLETASSLYSQEGQPLPLLAVKLSGVIANNDVSVPKVDLIGIK